MSNVSSSTSHSTFKPLARGEIAYLVANDFPGYIEAQERVDAAYRDEDRWTKMSIMSVAGSGMFSSDRTIKEYAEDIWKVKACKVPQE